MINRLRRAYHYDLYFRRKWVETQAALIPSGATVLDVGAGTGRYKCLFDHCQYFSHDFAKTPDLHGRYTALDYESDIMSIPGVNAIRR